jgi:hypothetical protein
MRGVMLMGVHEGHIAWARLYMEFVEHGGAASARWCGGCGPPRSPADGGFLQSQSRNSIQPYQDIVHLAHGLVR